MPVLRAEAGACNDRAKTHKCVGALADVRFGAHRLKSGIAPSPESAMPRAAVRVPAASC
jgi:hypothetical protein